MRLNKIKLAGFKSFVDPTTILMPSNLIGVVGPNGCGKSNTIDAVRWVMGESSAKHLRGASMEDVIFNGSSSRKPVGQASIELVFDNTDGKVGGEFANFNEISVRRQVSRDGYSGYFLNGTRCRRRDITDLFLGTGLGPRSYAIIEQGMITRLIEAKPLELRNFLEEAAGISKYRERRRETENRMRHTRENLDRLNDLRDEIGKLIRRLERQAKTAEKYTDLKQQERRSKAELLALHLRELLAQLETHETQLRQIETSLEKHLADLRQTEALIESLREQRTEASDTLGVVQQRFYQLGSEITTSEQRIQHEREMEERRLQETAETEQALARTQEDIARDEHRLTALLQTIDQLQPEYELSQARLEEAKDALAHSEQVVQEWQQSWEQHSRELGASVQKAQVERTKMEQLERQIQQLEQRQKKLEEEQGRIELAPLEAEINTLMAEVSLQQQSQEEAQAAFEAAQEKIEALREALRHHADQRESAQREARESRGRLASLEALQQAALGKDKKRLQHWLQQHELVTAPRLGEAIEAESGWTDVVEMILGDYLEAVEVKDLAGYAGALSEMGKGQVILFEAEDSSSSRGAGTLWQKVKAPACLEGILSSISVAENLPEALAMRAELKPSESIVTPDGLWLGKHWVRYSGEPDEHAGMLARKQEIATLKRGLEAADAKIESINEIQEGLQEQLQALESERQEQQAEVNQIHRAFAESRSRLGSSQSRLEQFRHRLNNLVREAEEIEHQRATEQKHLQQATAARNEALATNETLQQTQETFSAQREQSQQALQEARHAVDSLRVEMHGLNLKLEAARTEQRTTQQSLERMQAQSKHMVSRLESLARQAVDGDSPIESLQQKLETLLTQRVQQEQTLAGAKDGLQAIENQLREAEQRRHDIETIYNTLREEAEGLRLKGQETRVRSQTLTEQLAETEFEQADLLQQLGDNVSLPELETRVSELARKIDRLGPINLAAIDEFKEQSERAQYLDSQHEDLTKALNTLDNAIQKIDRETRDRFKETFDQVNTTLQRIFPSLFGGGHGHLELTEDDLLTTGVTVMARPPGKRITNIHLMSGGEKALTAVAMVFSIFELNPAPFCMLDEVDAPLDDANVGRFCAMVREMSKQVQFIFITHNKITMELADQLMGVTMRESGVSRIVDVDIDSAAKMATG